MSRHRSPAGRHAHPRPAPHEAAIPGARSRRTADAPRTSGGAAVALLERPPGDAWEAPRPAPDPQPVARATLAPRVPDRLPAPAVVRPATTARYAAPAVRNGLIAAVATAGVLSSVAPLGSLLPAAPAPTAGGTRSLALAADVDAASVDNSAAGDTVARLGLLAGAVEPVRAADDRLPPELDAAGLLKAVGLADVARQAEEARAAREAAARCDADLDGLGRVKPWVRDAAQFLSCLYERPDVLGVGSRARASDHPRGLAVDLMVRGEQGDRIADCALANQEALGITYVIYEQRVNYGDGWERMSDRGGDTANHMDHVHVSFERGAGTGEATAALCT